MRSDSREAWRMPGLTALVSSLSRTLRLIFICRDRSLLQQSSAEPLPWVRKQTPLSLYPGQKSEPAAVGVSFPITRWRTCQCDSCSTMPLLPIWGSSGGSTESNPVHFSEVGSRVSCSGADTRSSSVKCWEFCPLICSLFTVWLHHFAPSERESFLWECSDEVWVL